MGSNPIESIMRLIDPNADHPYEDEAIDVAKSKLDYNDESAEMFVSYLVSLHDETGYVPSSRDQAIGATNVLFHDGEGKWVNLIAFLQDMSDKQFEAVIKELYDWHNW